MAAGNLKKMSSALEAQVQYRLGLSTEIHLNSLLGKEVQLQWTGIIHCQSCGKVTKSSFGEGFCYSCFTTAPEASDCVLRPELCRAHLGEGRDPEWEQRNHNQPHTVYLAASSAIKVGITRDTQIPTRWIDQGASAAIRLASTSNRYEAGVMEVALKSIFTDKTHWQKMLRNEIDESIDLVETKWELEEQLPGDLVDLFTDDDTAIEIHYPVLHYPQKIKSLTLDKQATIRGTLVGIKGQYLIFESGEVFNVRKHTGYYVEMA